MQQHNPHRHSIRCHALGVTLDGFATRDVPVELAPGLPCVECDCRLATDRAVRTGPAKAKTAEPA